LGAVLVAEQQGGGIRLADLILPALAGAGAAFSPAAGRGIAVGLAGLGGVMRQREEQAARQREEMRLQDAIALEDQKNRAKLDGVSKMIDAEEAASRVPPAAGAEMGIRPAGLDPFQLKLARFQLAQGNVDGAVDAFSKAKQQPQFDKFEDWGYGQKRNVRTGEIAQIPTKPEDAPSASWRSGGYGVDELVDKQGNILKTRKVPTAPREDLGGLSPKRMQMVESVGARFGAEPVIRKVQIASEAVDFVSGLDLNSKNPADDQALIYAFAKAMDPDSVVREGEYATVQKYSQSWAERFGFNAARVLNNTEFMSPASRANMIKTIRARVEPLKAQAANVRSQYASKIDKISGQPGYGETYLVDYAAGFGGGDQQQAAPGASPATTPAAEPTATGPNGEKMVFRGGKWQPL
jgi:hypothetical protein